MNKDIVRQFANIFTFILTVTVNGLANALPINGLDTGQISDSFDVYFVPAGYVFSIWGLIYLLLAAFTVYQALPSQRENPLLRRIGWWFALSNLANATWIFLWHYLLFPLTLIVMLALLGSLITIYVRLNIQVEKVEARDRWLVHLPFQVYLGWITVATAANFTTTLDDIGWNGFGISPETWFVVVVLAVLVIAGFMAQNRKDIAYLLVLVWALVGIAIAQAGVDIVVNTSWVAAGLVGVMVIWSVVRGRTGAV